MKQAWNVRSFMWVRAQPQNISDVEPSWQARCPMVDLGMDLRKNTCVVQANCQLSAENTKARAKTPRSRGAANPSMAFRQSQCPLSSFRTVSCAGSKTPRSSRASLIEAQPGHQFHANLRMSGRQARQQCADWAVEPAFSPYDLFCRSKGCSLSIKSPPTQQLSGVMLIKVFRHLISQQRRMRASS